LPTGDAKTASPKLFMSGPGVGCRTWEVEKRVPLYSYVYTGPVEFPSSPAAPMRRTVPSVERETGLPKAVVLPPREIFCFSVQTHAAPTLK
jgi:hypothetical protein